MTYMSVTYACLRYGMSVTWFCTQAQTMRAVLAQNKRRQCVRSSRRTARIVCACPRMLSPRVTSSIHAIAYRAPRTAASNQFNFSGRPFRHAPPGSVPEADHARHTSAIRPQGYTRCSTLALTCPQAPRPFLDGPRSVRFCRCKPTLWAIHKNKLSTNYEHGSLRNVGEDNIFSLRAQQIFPESFPGSHREAAVLVARGGGGMENQRPHRPAAEVRGPDAARCCGANFVRAA
jgi:hypothetical protein